MATKPPNAYKRWYSRNREELLERQRDKYDPVAKAKYYAENADAVKAKMKEIYLRNKAERNKVLIDDAIKKEGQSAVKVAFLQEMLKGETYKTMGLRTLKSLVLV
jgi:hypothetical protein